MDPKKTRFARFEMFLRASAATCWRKRSLIDYIICHEIKTQLLEECSSDVGFRVRNFHQHCCARRSAWYFRSNHHFPPGLLTVDRTPNFGWNIGFNLLIDGRSVGSVAQGHSYSTWLPAGPHVLTVSKVPATGFTAPTSTTVNIQPGAEHLYTAMWDSDLVYLQPGGVLLTPGVTGKIMVMVPHNGLLIVQGRSRLNSKAEIYPGSQVDPVF